MVTKKKFLAYVRVQMAGNFNMITDAALVMDIIGVSRREYSDILRNYERYKNLFNAK